MPTPLESEFTARMRELVDLAPTRVPGYHPTTFAQMVASCGGNFVPKAKALLRVPDAQSGFKRLVKGGAPDLAMESVVLEEKFRPLFDDDDRASARFRLDNPDMF